MAKSLFIKASPFFIDLKIALEIQEKVVCLKKLLAIKVFIYNLCI